MTRLDAAVAVAERDGPAAGLRLVEAIADLDAYPPWHATRGELLLRLGRDEAAAAAFAAALAGELNAGQRALLEQRLSQARLP